MEEKNFIGKKKNQEAEKYPRKWMKKKKEAVWSETKENISRKCAMKETKLEKNKS